MRALPFLLASVLLTAGCLEAGGDAGGAPAADRDDGAAAAPPEPRAVPLRTLDEGSHSGIREAGRLVITDEAKWSAFWDEHRGYVLGGPDAAPAQAPEVDFSKERVVAAMLGERGNACHAIRASNATSDGRVTTIEITSYGPEPGMACASVVTHPFHIVALPADGTTIAFDERAATGPPVAE